VNRPLPLLAGRRRDDTGMSVVELVVAMMCASIVLAGVAGVFVGVMRVTRVVAVKTAATSDGRVAMEAMTRSLRVTSRPDGITAAFTQATPTSVSFYSSLNRGTTGEPPQTFVEYSWDGACLNESQTTSQAVTSPPSTGPFYTWPAANRRTTCLVRTTTAPAFSYYDDPLITSGGTTVTPMPDTSTAALRKAIRSVQVTLTVQDAANTAIAGTPLTSRVTLTNVLADPGSA
jgi:Tfp pilus assembly protein PilW